MVEKAKRAKAMDTIYLAASPKTVEKAKIVKLAPETALPVAGSIVPSIPEEAITKPVKAQIIREYDFEKIRMLMEDAK